MLSFRPAPNSGLFAVHPIGVAVLMGNASARAEDDCIAGAVLPS
jgi:hypothetical protein